jgi:hypothetical protein
LGAIIICGKQSFRILFYSRKGENPLIDSEKIGVIRMRNRILMITVMLAVMVAMSGLANAEPTLTSILNNTYGIGNYVEQTGSEFWFNPGTYTTKTLNVTDHQAGYTDPTGWYDKGSGSLHQVFDTPAVGEYSNIYPTGPFGLYINSSLNGMTTYKTEKSKNPDSNKHARVFKVNKVGSISVSTPTWAIGFEDLSLGDADYQDVVLELKGADLAIPEFPTVALPVAAVIGLVFFFQNKKKKEE